MKRINILLINSVLLISMLFLILSGCTVGQKAVKPPAQPGTPQQGRDMGGQVLKDGKVPDNIIKTQQLTQEQMPSLKQKADSVRKQVEGMAEVDRANVVVIGNTCLVGYKPSKASKDINTTKNMIINSVKKSDGTLDNVVVSESEDVINETEGIFNDIVNNKPVNEVSNKFMNLVARIKPAAS